MVKIIHDNNNRIIEFSGNDLSDDFIFLARNTIKDIEDTKYYHINHFTFDISYIKPNLPTSISLEILNNLSISSDKPEFNSNYLQRLYIVNKQLDDISKNKFFKLLVNQKGYDELDVSYTLSFEDVKYTISYEYTNSLNLNDNNYQLTSEKRIIRIEKDQTSNSDNYDSYYYTITYNDGNTSEKISANEVYIDISDNYNNEISLNTYIHNDVDIIDKTLLVNGISNEIDLSFMVTINYELDEMVPDIDIKKHFLEISFNLNKYMFNNDDFQYTTDFCNNKISVNESYVDIRDVSHNDFSLNLYFKGEKIAKYHHVMTDMKYRDTLKLEPEIKSTTDTSYLKLRFDEKYLNEEKYGRLQYTIDICHVLYDIDSSFVLESGKTDISLSLYTDYLSDTSYILFESKIMNYPTGLLNPESLWEYNEIENEWKPTGNTLIGEGSVDVSALKYNEGNDDWCDSTINSRFWSARWLLVAGTREDGSQTFYSKDPAPHSGDRRGRLIFKFSKKYRFSKIKFQSRYSFPYSLPYTLKLYKDMTMQKEIDISYTRNPEYWNAQQFQSEPPYGEATIDIEQPFVSDLIVIYFNEPDRQPTIIGRLGFYNE